MTIKKWTMNRLWRVIPPLAAGLLVSGAANATSSPNCSNAMLKGEYAFTVVAYTPPGQPEGPPQVVAGIKTFDGKGNFTQRDYIGDSLRTSGQTDFSTGETGTYTVNSDCTGNGIVNLPVPGVPAGTYYIKFVFTLSGGGSAIHEVVSEFAPPGFTGLQPTQTRATDWKVDSYPGDDNQN
jgi:hypothetical protein